MLRVDQVHVIRHKVLVEGRSVRAVARDMGVSRNTVRKYLGLAEPRRVEAAPRARPVLERVRERLEELLSEWEARGSVKQRVTGTRLQRQLVGEGYQVGTSLVRAVLRERRRRRQEVFVPLVHRPGDEAQVDFFQVVVEVAGVRRKAWLFLMRLMYSGRDFVWLYDRCDQLSFLDGHVRAFERLGGVPARLVYDNLSAAVKRILVGERELTREFHRLASHYLFEPCFARPGEGHDKGGVEARGRQLRLQQLVPLRTGESLQAVAQALLDDVAADEPRRRDRAGRSVSERFAEESGQLRSLPSAPLDARRVRPVVVSSRALVQVEGATYSVPSTWARLDATAYIGVAQVELVCRGERVAHDRVALGKRQVRYRHYLPELARKPQAVRQVAPELVAELGEPFGRLWSLLQDTHGAPRAARVLATVLGAVVRQGEKPVRDAVGATLASERQDVLRLLHGLQPRPAPRSVEVPACLAGYEVETAKATAYDHLLTCGEER